jgi:ABC-type branched-subunit amino acid transport system ATPase component
VSGKRFDGHEITGLPPHRAARLGVAKSYQITNIFPHLTVLENVRVAVQGYARSFNLWSRASELTDTRTRAQAILGEIGLARKTGMLAAHLSHGEKRHLELGIARPRRGRVVFRGEDITARETHEIVRRGIAWVPEERRVLPNLTVLENLRLGRLGTHACGGAEDFDEVLGTFPRLRERIDYKGRFLSGGEQQMLAIARGMDVLDQGRVQFEGTPDELRRDPSVQQRFLVL